MKDLRLKNAQTFRSTKPVSRVIGETAFSFSTWKVSGGNLAKSRKGGSVQVIMYFRVSDIRVWVTEISNSMSRNVDLTNNQAGQIG